MNQEQEGREAIRTSSKSESSPLNPLTKILERRSSASTIDTEQEIARGFEGKNYMWK